MIKYIFQVWVSFKGKDMPEEWKKAQQTIIDKNPNFKYKLYRDGETRDFVAKYFPFFLKTYDNFPYDIQRIDAFRYCVLYIHGGIYLDLDFIANKSFNVLEDELKKPIGLVRSVTRPDICTNAVMFAATKRHPFWLECIRQMMKPIPFFIHGKQLIVLTSTGPIMLNRVRKKKIFKQDYQFLNVVQNCNVCNVSVCKPDPNFILTPIEGSSWVGSDGKAMIWLFCHKKKIIKLFLIILAILIIYLFIRKTKI